MTTDKARAEACLNELQDLLGRIHNPGPEEAAQQIIEKHLTARDAEAALAKWQHEAEGLREDAAVGRMIHELLRLWPKPTEVYISPLRKDPRDETRPKDPDAFQVELNWGDSYTAFQSDTLAGAAKAALDAAGGA